LGYDLLPNLFEYERNAPLHAEERSLGVRDGLRWTHIAFRGGDDRIVPGIFVVPEELAAPAPGILLQHGAGTSKYARFVMACIETLGRNGYACLATDAIGHGERDDVVASDDEDEADAWRRLRGSPEFIVHNVIDFRRALDYLSIRPEVDASRLAYAGSSMGAMMGAVLCAVDQRPQVVILRCSGARETQHQGLDHLGFVGAIAPRPLLMLNNTEDEIFDRTAVLRLYAAAGEPKELRWFPGDHRANHDLHAAECLEWLERWLPVHSRSHITNGL